MGCCDLENQRLGVGTVKSHLYGVPFPLIAVPRPVSSSVPQTLQLSSLYKEFLVS